MAKGRRPDAARAFQVIASRLAGKQMELRAAAEYRRGIEGWLQHEAIVALDGSYYSDTSGRLEVFGRESTGRVHGTPKGLRNRPFDLWFKHPEMMAAIKVYLPHQAMSTAVPAVRKDLVALANHPVLGFMMLGRLDYRDGLGDWAGKRQKEHGADWCQRVIEDARVAQGLRLVPLVPQVWPDAHGSEYLEFWLPPLTDWDESENRPRTPTFHLGAWVVERSGKGSTEG